MAIVPLPTFRAGPCGRLLIALLAGLATSLTDATQPKATSPPDAIARDRDAVRGNWRVIELHVDGRPMADEEARRFTVTNAGDGTWVLQHDGGDFARGESTIDPESVPKSIDFTSTGPDGEVQHYLGIYELGEPTRKLCFARPGRPRPLDFTSTADNEQLLIVFQRE
jgi:uncharacterized protein (TIGR03067 family)